VGWHYRGGFSPSCSCRVVKGAGAADHRARGLQLPDNLITRLTGIRERRMADSQEYSSTFAIEAGKRAPAMADFDAAGVDLLIFASASRDILEPATAHIGQQALRTRAHAFDATNACNSFVIAVDIVRSMILAGRVRAALVVTGETPTRTMRTRPETYRQFRDGIAGYTFGDGGAAVVVEQVARGGITRIETVTHSEFENVAPQIVKNLFVSSGLDWADFRYALVHQVRRSAGTGGPGLGSCSASVRGLLWRGELAG
jgi:acyl-CoA:acyl-CoA alkyltransferase